MHVTLGKTGIKVNPVGFGGIPIQRLSMEESDRVVRSAIDNGINFFDTSRIYTDSEEKLGRVFSKYNDDKINRDSIVIASKTFSRDAGNATADLEKGLKLLKTDYIDIYQLHNIANQSDLQKVMAPGGALEALLKAKEAGKIRHIGITGHKPPVMIEALKAYEFETLQVPFNYIEQACLDQLVPMAKAKGIAIIAMKPVAGGAFKNVPLVLRFILNNGADVAIPGMDAVEQVKENLTALEKLNEPLTEAEYAILEEEKNFLGDEFCRRCEYCMPCPQGLPIAFLHVLRAYYLRYNLKEWAMERVNALEKSFKDCTGCSDCIEKCPYDLDTPKIFKETWEIMSGNT